MSKSNKFATRFEKFKGMGSMTSDTVIAKGRISDNAIVDWLGSTGKKVATNKY